MSRSKKIEMGVMNIKTHPHSAEKYIELFNKVFEIKELRKIRGDDWGTIGSLYTGDEDGSPYIYGDFYRFLNIDPKGKWFDTNNRTTVDPEEKGDPLPVAEHLKPNLKTIDYIFFPGYHRMFFDMSVISPKSMLALLNNMFSNQAIRSVFGEVDVSIESTHEAVKMIMSIHRLTKLTISYTRPNADDYTSEKARVVERFTRQGIKKARTIYSTTDQDGIKADDETIALMQVAITNGYVDSQGYDSEGKKEIFCTKDHPNVVSVIYEPDVEIKKDSMIYTAYNWLKKNRPRIL